MKEKKNVTIEYHADDYGLFPNQSHRILDCHRNGNLNGISVFPNSPHLPECMSDMHLFSEEVAVTVHLNLMEGKSLSQVPLLTDEEGRLNSSFGGLLLRSFLPTSIIRVLSPWRVLFVPRVDAWSGRKTPAR